MKRLGVLGTMVWDTIYGRGGESTPVEEWGGIAYALAALDVALPSDWQIVPLIKVGRDLSSRAEEFRRTLTRQAAAARFVEVREPNNRVTLRYTSDTRRTEHLVGGVPGWTWTELGPMVRDLDAIYLNFISGFELTLEAAQHLRRGYPGPLYADLHSLLLAVGHDGVRVPRSLPEAAAWFGCFDVVQINEDEMARLGDDPIEVAAAAIGAGVSLLVVTLGQRGAIYFTPGPFTFYPRSGRPWAQAGPIQTARIPVPAIVTQGDPTGCGDVFGATLVARLLGGDPLVTAIGEANALAGRNARCRGATGLQLHLRGELARR